MASPSFKKIKKTIKGVSGLKGSKSKYSIKKGGGKGFNAVKIEPRKRRGR